MSNDMNMGFLMRNLMDKTKKKRYTQSREKHMKKLYGILPERQISDAGHIDAQFDKNISNSPYKDDAYLLKQSSVRQNLISEVQNKQEKKK